MVDVARVNLYGQPIGSVRLCATGHRAISADDARKGRPCVQFRRARQNDLQRPARDAGGRPAGYIRPCPF